MTTNTSNAPAHSAIMGGSTAAQRIKCPGSYLLEEQVPREQESEFAARGSALHEAMEHYLVHMEGKSPDELVGMKFYNGIEITQELVDTKINPALKAFNEIIDAAGGDMDFMVEVQVSLDRVIPGAFGTVDVLGRGADGRLWVIDWKFGDGVMVSPEASYQLAFYCAAAMYDEDEDITEFVYGAEDPETSHQDIVFAIVQPALGRPNERDWAMWETNDAWVESFVDLAVAAVDKAQATPPVLNMGSHCRWCRAKTICPLQQAQVVSMVDNTVAPASMDEVTMATWLDRAEQIETFIADLRKHAHAEAERGVKIPGWKLVPKRGTRAYNDAAQAEAALRKMAGIKVADIMEIKLKSPAQLEKSIPKQKFVDFASKHITMVSSGTTLARDTDKRPDVSDPSKQLGEKLKAKGLTPPEPKQRQ